MKKQQNLINVAAVAAEKEKKEQRTDIVIGVLTVVVMFAVFSIVFAFAGVKTAGKIAYDGNLRKGNEKVFTYSGNSKLKEGDIVKWYVDGECVAEDKYDGQQSTMRYTPENVGQSIVKIVSGKYTRSTLVVIEKPLLTLNISNTTVTYGEVPTFDVQCIGLLDGDSKESLNIMCKCDCSGEVGQYPIEATYDADGYEVNVNGGVLTVEPKDVHILGSITKIYDKTNILKNADLQLEGVLEGDDVVALGEVEFSDSNVGEKSVSGITLGGKDASNYRFVNDAVGRIIPKGVILEGLSVCDKYYDGTVNAKIDRLGKLAGIEDGDSVAIGVLNVCFENASVGVHKVIVRNIALVGLDKDNYYVAQIAAEDAEILSAD